MNKFMTINHVDEIKLSEIWVNSKEFKADQVVDQYGNPPAGNYNGRLYTVVASKERSFSTIERIGRGLLGVITIILSLGIAYFQSDAVKNLFSKKERIDFGILFVKKNEIIARHSLEIFKERKSLDGEKSFANIKEEIVPPIIEKSVKEAIFDLREPEKELPQKIEIDEPVEKANEQLDAAQNKYPIFIKTLTKLFEIIVQPNDTILDVKKKIELKHGIVVDQQRLIFNGKTLNDRNTIESYNIQEISELMLIMVTRGD